MNKKILLGLSSLMLVGVLTGCGGNGSSSKPSSTSQGGSNQTSVSESQSESSASVSVYEPDLTDKVTVRMSVNYDKTTGMKYNMEGTYSTPSGKEIKNGDFKPVYSYLQDTLNFTIDDVTDSSDKAVNSFKSTWAEKNFKGVDMACGNVSDIVSNSVKGESEMILDVKEYLNYMPNFKKFLVENPTVQKSILTAKHGDASKTGIYYLPYFDGYNDLEKMTLLRADYVRKLLDGEFNAADWDENTALIPNFGEYTSHVADKSYEVEVTNSDGTTKKFTKVSTENIIAQMNALGASERNAKTMVKLFRDYIDAKYANAGFANRSDLFLGTNACYDADEMVALMRLVKASPKALTGSDATTMVPFNPREYNNQRCADIYRWAAQMFGVRGLESRLGYLYTNSEGKIVDCRGQQDVVDMLATLNTLYKEGLIMSDIHNESSLGASKGKFADKLIPGNAGGFMEYDYAQTQGAYNDKAASTAVEGYDFRPIIAPVAKWNDGDSTTGYYSFTESWRSVKSQGWCITADAKTDEKVLMRTLAIADWFYSDDGHQTNSFGPSTMGYTDGTFEYMGKQIAKLSDKSLEQLADANIGNGSYTNYLRKFVGATLPIGYIKEQGMEYQMTSQKSRDGLAIVNKALLSGTYKHVQVTEQQNKFFQIVPSALRISSGNAQDITDLNKDKLSTINSDSSTSSWNIWDNYVMFGFGGNTGSETLKTTSEYLELVNKTWNLPKLVQIYQDAYDNL